MIYINDTQVKFLYNFALTKSYASNTLFIHNLKQAVAIWLPSTCLKPKWSCLNGTERTQKYNMLCLISLNPLYNWIFDLPSSARSSYTSGSWAPVRKKRKSFIVHLNSQRHVSNSQKQKTEPCGCPSWNATQRSKIVVLSSAILHG